MSDIQLHGNIYPKFVTQSHRIQGKKMPAEKKNFKTRGLPFLSS